MLDKLKSAYGAGPLHMLAVFASFAVITYAFIEIFDQPKPFGTLLWFGGAVIAHDVIAFPLYSILGLIAGRGVGIKGKEQRPRMRVAALNHIRVPIMLSALYFLVFFPLILGKSDPTLNAKTGLNSDPFLGRWLLLSAFFMVGSAVIFAIRLRMHASDGPESPYETAEHRKPSLTG